MRSSSILALVITQALAGTARADSAGISGLASLETESIVLLALVLAAFGGLAWRSRRARPLVRVADEPTPLWV